MSQRGRRALRRGQQKILKKIQWSRHQFLFKEKIRKTFYFKKIGLLKRLSSGV